VLLFGAFAIWFIGPPTATTRGFDPTTVVPSTRISQMGRYANIDFNLLAGFPYGELPGRAARASVSYEIPSTVAALSGTLVSISGYMLSLYALDADGVSIRP